MYRSCIIGLLAGSIGLMSVTQAIGQQACRPALAVKQAQRQDGGWNYQATRLRAAELHRPEGRDLHALVAGNV